MPPLAEACPKKPDLELKKPNFLCFFLQFGIYLLCVDVLGSGSHRTMSGSGGS